MPVDGYATYQPQKSCAEGQARHPGARPVAGGPRRCLRRDSRDCRSGGILGAQGRAAPSTGRLDAKSRDDQATAEAFLNEAFADDEDGDTDALARRMGIMYVIWNDQMYSAWDGFEPRALPQLRLHAAEDVLEDAAPPRPHAHLAEQGRRAGEDQLVRRAAGIAPTARHASVEPFVD